MEIFCVIHKERKKFNELQNSNNHDKESKKTPWQRKQKIKKVLFSTSKQERSMGASSPEMSVP